MITMIGLLRFRFMEIYFFSKLKDLFLDKISLFVCLFFQSLQVKVLNEPWSKGKKIGRTFGPGPLSCYI